MSDPFHYPSELLEILVDTIPRLVKSKDAVLTFFSSAGVQEQHLAEPRRRLRTSRAGTSKFTIARTILQRLNEAGDSAGGGRGEHRQRSGDIPELESCRRRRADDPGYVDHRLRVGDERLECLPVLEPARNPAQPVARLLLAPAWWASTRRTAS